MSIETTMADADSLVEQSSGIDQGSSADDADAEDEPTLATSGISEAKKKSKRKKRQHRGMEPSSEESDNILDSEDGRSFVPNTLSPLPGTDDNIASGAVASSSGTSVPEEKREKKLTHHEKAKSPQKTAEAVVSCDDDDAQGAVVKSSAADAKQAQATEMTMQRLREMLIGPQHAPKSMEEAKQKHYQFWDTQPVPKLTEKIDATNEAIEPDKPVEEIRKEPYSLPPGFQWDTLDINQPLILKELYTLLNENYVEDEDNMFRFDYSPEFLLWALQPPGWLKQWHTGVRVIKSEKLVGFISAVPAHVKIYEKDKKLVEINFLCVHKKLRSKRMAPVLIKEITRRVHCQGIFQAVYTAGVVLPKPVSSCRYWHRSLNPKKLIEVKFSHLSRNMTMQRTLKLYKLPEATKTPGFRTMRVGDIREAHQLLHEYLQGFNLSPMFTEDEFRHWFLPRDGIVHSFVVERDGKITDFTSFYSLPSTVMHHAQHNTLRAAYSFYNVARSTSWPELMQDVLITARSMGFDVFNALDLMDNKQFLEKLKFGIGDGNLQYYMYNWRCPNMEPSKMGLVLQ